jgi:hypothetical protein
MKCDGRRKVRNEITLLRNKGTKGEKNERDKRGCSVSVLEQTPAQLGRIENGDRV